MRKNKFIDLIIVLFGLSIFGNTYIYSQDNNENTSLGDSLIKLDIEYFSDAEQRANEAEKKAAAAMKVLKKIENKLSSLEKKLKGKMEEYSKKYPDSGNNSGNNSSDQEALKKEIEKYKQQISDMQEKQKTAEKAKDVAVQEMVNAYKDLAKIYKDANYTGDPVLVTDGSYHYEKAVFNCNDLLEEFEIRLSYDSDYSGGYFGKNWYSSLDSRIVRGLQRDSAEIIDFLTMAISDANDLYSEIETYEASFTDYYYNQDDKAFIDYLYNNSVELLPLYQAAQIKRNSIKSANSFVCYGTFSNPDSYEKGFNVIYYVNQDNVSIPCFYEGEGVWKPVGIFSNNFEIYSKDNYGNKTYSDNAEGGFIVKYTSGATKYYSYFGLLEKEEDNNHNIRTYIYDEITKRLEKIKLSNGIEIVFNCVDNRNISEIVQNNKSKTKLNYSDGILRKITQSNGTETLFSYNENNLLNSISKNEENVVSINYEYNNDLNKYVVSSTENVSGAFEYFNYDYKNKEVSHQTYSGKMEYYKFNDRKQIIWKKDMFGVITEYTFNDKNQLVKVEKNGKPVVYEYDSDGRPYKVQKGAEPPSITHYDDKGNVVIVVDADGNCLYYDYDDRRNLIEISCNGINPIKIKRNEYGQVEELKEMGLTYRYEYNSIGLLTKKSVYYPDGVWEFQETKYDKNNDYRTSSFRDWDGTVINYSYKANSDGSLQTVTATRNNLKTKITYDKKGRIQNCEKTDLQGKKREFIEYTYTPDGKIKSLSKNGIKYDEYEYNSDGQISKYTVWDLQGNAVCTEYEYEEHGYESFRKVYEITKNGAVSEPMMYKKKYSFSSNKMTMQFQTDNSAWTVYEYDMYGKLLNVTYPNGNKKNYTYTQGGALESVTLENCNIVKERDYITYKGDGTYYVMRRDANGRIAEFFYDSLGRLVKAKDYDGNQTLYIYDSRGKLIKTESSLVTEEYKYDSKNRIVCYTIKDTSGKICYEKKSEYNDTDNTMTVKTGDFFDCKYWFDDFGRVITIENSSGISTYDFDSFGKINKVILNDGTPELRKYNSYGLLVEKNRGNDLQEDIQYYPDGSLKNITINGRESVFAKYDDLKNAVNVRGQLGIEYSFGYAADGTLESKTSKEFGTTRYSFDKNSHELVKTYSDNSKRTKKYNSSGKLESETNTLGKRKNYSYDSNGKVKTVTDYSGKTTQYSYDKKAQEITVKYPDGTSKLLKYSPLGKPVVIQNESGTYKYTYNSAGLLTSVYDSSSEIEIIYEYDSFGRIAKKKSPYFEFLYGYDSNGNMALFEEKESSVSVEMEYDENKRETKRTLSNGIQIFTTWNEYGEVQSVVAKQNYGLILSAEVNVYDDDGRLCINCSKDGEYIHYGYDDKGRLSFTEYVYQDKLIEAAKKEAVLCGIFIKDEKPSGTYSTITDSQLKKVNQLLSQAGIKKTADKNQFCWREEYEYTLTGSIKSVANPFGKIVYTYDSERRLLSKNGTNTLEKGIKYAWSDNGNLLEIKSETEKTRFIYGENNRPSIIRYENIENGQTVETSYTYDGLNRRISETVNGIDTRRFVYDGFSSNVILTTPVYQNNELFVKYQENAIKLTDADSASDLNRYRTVPVEEYDEAYRYKTDFYEVKTEKISFPVERRPYVTLFCGKNAAADIYTDGSKVTGKSVEYKIPDYNNTKVLSVSDENGTCTETCLYGTWGYSIEENRAGCYSNAAGKLSTVELIYDLGNRDYIPSMKSFTTEDPVQDGENWYAFCSCDCVNFYDGNGYEKIGLTPEEYADYSAAMAEFMNFDEDNYHETGEDHGIPREFDCADLAHFLDMIGLNAAGKEPSGDVAEKFTAAMENGNKQAAMNETKASFFTDKPNLWDLFHCGSSEEKIQKAVEKYMSGYLHDESYRKVTYGFDRDYLVKKTGDSEAEEGLYYRLQEKVKEDTYVQLRDPDIIKPGTKLQWEKTGLSTSQNWEAHVATILARDFDEEGNIIGYVIIEGHTKGDQTELLYMSLLDGREENVDNFMDWMGLFNGAFEIEAKKQEPACE